MKFSSPKIETGSIVTSFHKNIDGVTPKKLYVVEDHSDEFITIRSDLNQLVEVRKIFFMEADVVYSILFLTTLNRLFDDIF